MSHLLFSQHGKVLLQIPLTKSNTQVGRSSECDVILSEPSISRFQFSVYQMENSYFVKNLGKAKLKLNGKEIEASTFSENDSLELEGWKIHLAKLEKKASQEETYISDMGMRETQVLNLSRGQRELHYESLSLKVKSSQESEKFFSLKQGTNTIGKSPSCDIRLSDSYVSEVHAKLICESGKVVLYDLRSTNGSYVNGLKVSEVELTEESVCKLGNTELVLQNKSHTQAIKPLNLSAFGPFIGKSPKMQELYSLIQQIAPTTAPVCILGETGTGKELVAKSLHDLSGRQGPWITVNCGAISKELIQSELFGHEKGAFTGALQQRAGVFEQAKGGTLFLDEVAELPLELQANLLRVLESGKVKRVGGNQEISVDARIVCATHQNLAKAVEEKKFRQDLFFRLNVLPLEVPALRDKREDIPVLAQHFLKQFSPSQRALEMSSATLELLSNYTWPGNIREFKNAIQRAVILAKGEVLEPADFGFLDFSAHAKMGESLSFTRLEDMEKKFILEELKRQDFNKVATARALGIAKSTLYEKLKGYGIQ